MRCAVCDIAYDDFEQGVEYKITSAEFDNNKANWSITPAPEFSPLLDCGCSFPCETNHEAAQ